MQGSTISKHKKRAVIYTRVSTQEQDTDRQVRDLKEFAERSGYDVLETFSETASGLSPTRTERFKIMQLAQARKIDVVLVTELTRWGRSTVDLLGTLQTLNEQGVSIVAERGDQFDLSTAQGKMIAGVLSVLAQFERDLISERTKSGMKAAAARGSKLGRPVGNQTDSKHREAVLEMRAAGLTMRDIATKLKIGTQTVQSILKQPAPQWEAYQ